MDEKLWELIKGYGTLSFQAGVISGRVKDDDKRYDEYTRRQDNALAQIKRYLTSKATECCPDAGEVCVGPCNRVKPPPA